MNFVTKHFWTNMNVPLTCILVLVVLPSSYGKQQESFETNFSKFIADLWLEGADVIRIIWRDCSKSLVDVKDVIDHKEYFPKFVRCMKRKTLRALDRSLTPDVVPIGDGVSLVRFELVDPSGNIIRENDTSTWSDNELDESDWRTLALQRMAKVLKTHVIKFDLERNETNFDKAEYRGRRRHHMLTMMMFGIVSIGMVLVPMGFQFLAVLGGKALLLAKMALVLASIQGLKKVDPNYESYHERGKIATSPVSYGFYHSYPPPYDHYQKRSQENWSPPIVTPSIPHSLSQIPRAIDTSDIKVGIIQKRENKEINDNDFKNARNNIRKKSAEMSESGQVLQQRLFPVYIATSEYSEEPIEAPSSLVDSTTTPGQVQADFALDLPYNRFHFQSPPTVVST